MIGLLNTAFFLFLVLTAFLVFRAKRRGSIVFILMLFWFVVKVPFYFLDESFVPEELDLEIYTLDNFSNLIGSKSAFIISAFVAYMIVARRHLVNGFKYNVPTHLIISSLVLFSLILLLYFEMIGGLHNLWSNLGSRSDVIKGSAFFITILWALATIVIVFAARLEKLTQFFIVLFLAACMYVAYGGRSLSVGLFVLWFVYLFFVDGKMLFNLFNIRIIPLYAIAMAFFIITPLLRQENAFDIYMNSAESISLALVNNWQEIFQRLAVPQVELLVIDYFSLDRIWAGASWLDLSYLFCPVSVCLGKPPIDDGVYLYNIYLGADIVPGLPVSDMVASSFPFETWSIFYANFGFIGLFVGGALYGTSLAVISNLCWSANIFTRIYFSLVVGYVAINFFHFSNLYFGITLIPLLIFLVALFCAASFRLINFNVHVNGNLKV